MTRLQDSGEKSRWQDALGTRARKKMGRRLIGVRRALLHERGQRTSVRSSQERLEAEVHRSQVSWTARTDGCYEGFHGRRNCLLKAWASIARSRSPSPCVSVISLCCFLPRHRRIPARPLVKTAPCFLMDSAGYTVNASSTTTHTYTTHNTHEKWNTGVQKTMFIHVTFHGLLRVHACDLP